MSVGLFGVTHYNSETGEPIYVIIKPDYNCDEGYIYKYLKCIPDPDVAMEYINLLKDTVDVKIHKETGEVIYDEKELPPESDLYKKKELFNKIF